MRLRFQPPVGTGGGPTSSSVISPTGVGCGGGAGGSGSATSICRAMRCSRRSDDRARIGPDCTAGSSHPFFPPIGERMARKRLLIAITLAETGGAQSYVAHLLPALTERYDVVVAAHGHGPL